MPPSRNGKSGVPLSLITQLDSHSPYNVPGRKKPNNKQAQDLRDVSYQFHGSREPYKTPVSAAAAVKSDGSPTISIKTEPNNNIHIDKVQNEDLNHNYLGHNNQDTLLEIARLLNQTPNQVLPNQQQSLLNPPAISSTQTNLSALIAAINENNINELQMNDMNLNTIPMDIALYLAGRRAEKSMMAKLAVVNFLREECWRMDVEGMSDFLEYVVGLCKVMGRETGKAREGGF